MWFACYQLLPVVQFCRVSEKPAEFNVTVRKMLQMQMHENQNQFNSQQTVGKRKKKEGGSKGLKERERLYIMLMLIAVGSAAHFTAATIASDNKNQMLLKASLPLTTKQPWKHSRSNTQMQPQMLSQMQSSSPRQQ